MGVLYLEISKMAVYWLTISGRFKNVHVVGTRTYFPGESVLIELFEQK